MLTENDKTLRMIGWMETAIEARGSEIRCKFSSRIWVIFLVRNPRLETTDRSGSAGEGNHHHAAKIDNGLSCCTSMRLHT